jgi:hypothetical protein
MMPGVCRVGSVEAEGISMIVSWDTTTGKTSIESGSAPCGAAVVNQSAILAPRRHCTKINPPRSRAVITLAANKNAIAGHIGRAS